MENLKIRRAKECDIPIIDKLLYEVHKVHSDVRPDLFKAGAKKYSDEDLKAIIKDCKKPVFGRSLYEYVLDYARNNEYYNVTLNVWADNKNAVKFYDKLGLKIQKIGMEKIL